MHQVTIFLLLIATLGTATAADQARGKQFSAKAKSLCSFSEEVVFSCRARSKTVSVCATRFGSKIEGLTYRFGRSDKVELAYPVKLTPPQVAFTTYNGRWAKGNEVQLEFHAGVHSYTVYSYSSAFNGEGSGVLVSKAGSEVTRYKCTETVEDNLWDIEPLGLKTHERRDAP